MSQDPDDDIWESAPMPRRSASKAQPVALPLRTESARPVRAHLVEQNGGQRRLALPTTATFTLGRSESADLRLEGPAIAGRHAVIKAGRRRYYVEDLSNGRGTFVNGELVRSARRLEDGDCLQIGGATFQIQYSARPPLRTGHGLRSCAHVDESTGLNA